MSDQPTLRELHENATPGPWDTGKRTANQWIALGAPVHMYHVGEAADAAFIAGWRNAAEALLDVVEAARNAWGECVEWAEYQHGNPAKIINAIEPRLRAALEALDRLENR